ncbi:MAG: decaprenyl-phosphate phosphoribosyltransferase [Anaerolineae bacterium]
MRSSEGNEPRPSSQPSASNGLGRNTLLAILKSMRPRQWSKNLFIFLPMMFTIGQYWRPLSPSMWQFLELTVGGFVVFCLLSGVVYIINDLVDIEKDRAHPRKRNRPIASGQLGKNAAIWSALVILVAVLAGSVLLDLLAQSLPYPGGAPVFPFPFAFTLIGVSYMALQIAYSFYLKHIVIIDVFSIAAGFLMRAIAGAVVIQVPISPWLYVVTLLLALFLGFGKRRNELVLLEGAASRHRAILREYTPDLLDQILSITSASTVIAYSLYTFSAENLPRNHYMMATIPFTLYGIFRYLYLIHVRNEGGSPEEILMKDRPFLIAALAWGIAVMAILYLFGKA